MAFENILVVCVGNICRSPIAAALLIDEFPQKNIDSAGLSAVVGHSADAKAQEVMRVDGLDMSDHIAKQIDEALVTTADLILTMSTNQTRWINNNFIGRRSNIIRPRCAHIANHRIDFFIRMLFL